MEPAGAAASQGAQESQLLVGKVIDAQGGFVLFVCFECFAECGV